MSLTHIQISNAKPRKTAYKLTDADALYLMVRPNGSKLWRMNYRHLGRQKTLYFGSWPDVGIADARELRDAARKKIITGVDPAAEKKVARITRKIAEDNSFAAIAEEWIAKNERDGLSPKTLSKTRCTRHFTSHHDQGDRASKNIHGQ
ncbi:MAG: hypothetical protein CVT74_06040 [Alphaproteobacteria bacterium HGW-Alphaproteobacteria-13]|nr:MAG: hypothetical protein CVT74_06040 [Alphaproteobacteria bacterium HGW-Alphaproteobacteria-13]